MRIRRTVPLVAAVAVVLVPMLVALLAVPMNALYDSGRIGRIFVRAVPMHLVVIGLVVGTVVAGRRIVFVPAERNRPSWLLDRVIPALGALMIAVVIFWPVSRWGSFLYGGAGDNYNWRWQIWRFGQELRHWHLFPTRFDDVVAPYGVDLRLNDGYVGMYIGGLWNLVSGPTFAYNLTVVTAIVLNFWSARRLSLRISSNRAVAFLAAVAAATSPSFTLRYYGHLNLCFTFVVFLVAAEALDLLRESRIRVVQPTLLIALSFLSSFYFFVLASLVYFGVAVVRMARNTDRAGLVRDTLRILAVGTIVLIVVSPFVVARLQHDNREKLAGAPAATARTDEYMYYSADPRFFYVPSYDSRVQLPGVAELRAASSPNTVENTPFPGFLFIAAIGLLVLTVPRWRWLMGSLWSLLTVMALGPTLVYGAAKGLAYWFPRAIVDSPGGIAVSWLPYQDLAHLPGLTALRTPNRFAMALPVVGVIALALVARHSASVLTRRRFATAATLVAVLLLAPNLRSSSPWWNSGYSRPVSGALDSIRADRSDRRVVVAGDNCLMTMGAVNTQIEHHHPMIGCQTFSAAMPWYSDLSEYKSNVGLASIQCDSRVFGQVPTKMTRTVEPTASTLASLARDLRVGWVIVDKAHICAGDPARQGAIVGALDAHARLLAQDPAYAIYALN